jgi:hypothetical protein
MRNKVFQIIFFDAGERKRVGESSQSFLKNLFSSLDIAS